MKLQQFDVEQACNGFPDNRQLEFRFERCCIVLLVQHLLKSNGVHTKDVKKVFLRLEPRDSLGLHDVGDFERIAEISWPFDCSNYFSAGANERSAILADAAEAALKALAQRRSWPVAPIREIFSKIREANYTLEADRAKACRSPDGTKRARVSYFVDRTAFRVDVVISNAKQNVLLTKTVYSGPPTHGLCVDSVLGKPFWKSENEFIVPFRDSGVSNGEILVVVQ